MKIAIVGAGGIGGYVGAKLALAGEDVTFMVRGANLEAIRKNGIKLIANDGAEFVAGNVRATNNYDEAGVQDVVILALKANQVEAVAYGTEAGHFQRYGIPAVICGPGSIEQAHRPDEFCELSELAACEVFLRKVIAKACA